MQWIPNILNASYHLLISKHELWVDTEYIIISAGWQVAIRFFPWKKEKGALVNKHSRQIGCFGCRHQQGTGHSRYGDGWIKNSCQVFRYCDVRIIHNYGRERLHERTEWCMYTWQEKTMWKKVYVYMCLYTHTYLHIHQCYKGWNNIIHNMFMYLW